MVYYEKSMSYLPVSRGTTQPYMGFPHITWCSVSFAVANILLSCISMSIYRCVFAFTYAAQPTGAPGKMRIIQLTV
jgi:hypothetical protein